MPSCSQYESILRKKIESLVEEKCGEDVDDAKQALVCVFFETFHSNNRNCMSPADTKFLYRIQKCGVAEAVAKGTITVLRATNDFCNSGVCELVSTIHKALGGLSVATVRDEACEAEEAARVQRCNQWDAAADHLVAHVCNVSTVWALDDALDDDKIPAVARAIGIPT